MMESISRLRAVLLNSLGNRGSQHSEQELFDELMVHKSCLLRVFDVGQRSAQEQRELESGKIVVNGKPLAVNSDFARQVIFLSQQLSSSERYISGLLQTITSENPNISSLTCLELTIAEFHQRRRHLVDSLRFIFEAALSAEGPAPTEGHVFLRLDAFVRQDLIPAAHADGEISLAYRVLKEIENLGNAISTAQVAKQSAGSNTTAPSQQGGNPTLGYDILNARYDSLKYERRNLAVVLYLIAQLGYLSPNEIQQMVEWLAANPNHAMTYYILTALLAAFDPVDPQTMGGRIRRNLAMHEGTMTFMAKTLDPATEWKDPGLKATILLKWTLFLTEARHRDPSLEHRAGFKTEELETQIWNAVQGDAFIFLTIAMLQLQWRRGISPAASFASTLSISPEQEQLRDVPTDDFKPTVLRALETLVRTLITHASSELRKIKQRQEDLVLASARSDRTRLFRSETPATGTRFSSSVGPDLDKTPHAPPRNDIAMLYSFIGLLYSALPPERALQFWGSGPQIESQRTTYLDFVETTAGKLPAFLQWAVWSTQVRDVDMTMSLYDMLAGLAKGQHCSELAYNFMARGAGEVIAGSVLPSSSNSAHYNAGPTVSWSVIFGVLESWSSPTSSRTSQAQAPATHVFGFSSAQPWQSQAPLPNQPPPPHQLTLGPKDVLLAQSFLRLLSTVVTHSVAVRVAIAGHTHFRAIPMLLSLIPLGVPLELKGALFETLAAFCEPGAGVAGVEICKAVWTLMERLEIINVRGTGFGAGSSLLPSDKGVEVELEEVEAVYGMYPATIPFLKLLSTLLHTPKRVSLKDRIADAEPINTVPEGLGQPYRIPGIGPFVSFVVDNVFSKISNREYLRPSDRWRTNDLCLCFIERALASYDLESLVTSAEDTHLREETIIPLLLHPGYDVMTRMLTNSLLRANIQSYIVEGLEGFEKDLAAQEPYFRNTIIRVLRIVHRVLENQDIFLDVLIPLMSEFDCANVTGTVRSRSYFTRFDQALSFGPQYVPALAAYVAYPAHPELVLISVKIITVLSSSNAFANLAALIEQSNDSERILNGYKQVIDRETMEDVTVAEAIAEKSTGAGAPDIDGSPESLEQAIRLAVLDLFIQNTGLGRSYPNIAHFLLFGGTNSEEQIQDPHALGARPTCIHVILDLLNSGVPRVKGKGKERDRQHSSHVDPFFVSLPGFAERCYRVVYQLCVHPRTSDFTMRYLRTREDFFARQLAAIPSKVPATLQEPVVEVLYNDGSRVATTVSALSSFLRLRSWIFDLVALDLHVLTNKGHFKGVTELLEILFGNDAGYHQESPGWEDGLLQPFRELGQSHLRIIEFLRSLNFDWSDDLTVKPVELQFLGQLNLLSCIRADSTGCEVVDRTALLSLLAAARRALHMQGSVVTPAQLEQLTAETTYILESCAVENHRREVRYATATGYEAWRRLLDMTLTKCFTRLPHDHRESMLFDLLHVLPGTICSTDIHESTAALLSEATLSSITKLREDRRHQIIIQSAGGDAEAGSLPAERLYALLRSILDCVLDSNHSEIVRGNLYAALINYLHLIASADTSPETFEGAMSLSASTTWEDYSFGDGQSVIATSQLGRSSGLASSLEIGSLAVMKSGMERLIATISGDAIDGTEVWKTIAFMLLDSLVQISRLEKPHVVLSALIRHGILSNFVRGIKESDWRLQSVLKPDPDDLNPLYVYEAKMSLFIRMAQTRAGAERLLEAQLLPILAQCDYLDARPEGDQSFLDHDSFLPSAIHRYHQLFMPALQVIDGMLATLGSKHTTATNQALDFLSSHRDTVVILLKNETESGPLALVEEMHLLVTLCASVLSLVPKSELISANSGFGGIHATILSLATRCLSSGSWMQSVRPQTDAEILDASAYASGYGTDTKFDISVRQKERLLRKAIITYVGTASEFTEPDITFVLSPITNTTQGERGSRFLAAIPTVGDAVEALNDICGDLADTLKQIADLSAELSSKDHIEVDNIQEIVNTPDVHFLQDLDIGQKRELICRELRQIRSDVKNNAKTLLSTLEMLLLLLWRHVVYYSERRHSGHLPLKSSNSTSQAMRFLSSPEPEAFCSEVGKKLAPVLQRLDLDYETLGNDGRASQAYVEIMARRLKDCLHESIDSVEGF